MPNNNAMVIAELDNIIKSKQLYKIMQEHKEYLQKEVNKFVRAQNIIDAYAALSKLEDYNNIIRLVEKKIQELKKEN